MNTNNLIENTNCINTPKQNNNTRILYLDILRIFSSFTVILLHICSMPWQSYSPRTFTWQVSNFYLSLVKFNVPLFVMISGALFLDPCYNLSIKKLYKKNILKLLFVYLIWSFIYSLFNYWFDGISLQGFNRIKYIIKSTLNSHYHLWFLPMIISIYIIIPIFKPITESNNAKKIIEYFLILFILFGILNYSLFELDFPYKSIIKTNFAKISPPAVGSWFGFFLLGYYLKKYKFTKCTTKTIYIVSIIFYLFSVISSALISYINNIPKAFFYYNFGITTFLVATLWFLVFKNHFENKTFSKKSITIISFLSKNTLGIYLIHAMIITIFEKFGININIINPVLSIPIISIVIFSICNILIYILSKIPIIKKII